MLVLFYVAIALVVMLFAAPAIRHLWCVDCTVVAFESGHGDFGTYLVDLWQNAPKECTFIATRPFKLIEE